jgi:N-acetylmuramoyl-L-alanine amidase
MTGYSRLRKSIIAITSLALAVLLLACNAAVDVKATVSETEPTAGSVAEVVREARSEQTSATTTQPATTSQPATQATEPDPPQPRPKIITLDPGHGGSEIGAVSVIRGNSLAEKDSNLDMAYRLRLLLIDAGYQVVLTRQGDVRATGESGGSTQFPITRFDLQRRIDIANEAGSDLFLSIHSNGSGTASESGVEVWWEPNRPWGAENQRFAQLVQRRVVDGLTAWGYRPVDRGIKDNSTWRFARGRYVGIFVIAPPRDENREEVIRRGATPEEIGFAPGSDKHTTNALNMPSALVENLFLSHDTDATVLRDPGARDAIARAMLAAIDDYFGAAR